MALSGTLADVAVVDLLQLPHVGRRSGCMTLHRGKEDARVYFVDGGITHAELGSRLGMDVLVELLDWENGDFLFEAGLTATTRSLETDLHRSIMMALKLRDERRQEKRQEENRPMELVAKDRLERFVGQTPTLRDVALVTREGTCVASARREPDVDGIQQLRDEMVRSFAEHARPGMTRVVMEDEAGVLVGQAVEGAVLVLAFTSGTAVGVAVHVVGKLVTELARSEGKR